MKFVLASHNKGKLAEMQRILGQLGVEVVLQSDLGLALEPEENGTTFAENAMIKAKAVMQASGLPAIADDSGLCVDALGGAPGIYSARYGGLDDDKARYQLLLQNLRGAMTRAAHFHTSVVCCFPDGDVLTAELNLLGTAADVRQEFIIVLIATDGQRQTLARDMTGALSDFNRGTDPMTLDATLELMNDALPDADITDWVPSGSEEGDAV